MSEKASSNFLVDFALGGVSGAVAKTCTAPIERVKLIIQTQDANPKIKSGEIPRYTGISNCFTRVYSEQGLKAFWRGNTTNIIRYFPTQAFNFAFKDTIKGFFPKVQYPCCLNTAPVNQTGDGGQLLLPLSLDLDRAV